MIHWFIAIGLWVALMTMMVPPVLSFLWLAKNPLPKDVVRRYPRHVLARAFLPFYSGWESVVRPEDMEYLKRFRKGLFALAISCCIPYVYLVLLEAVSLRG